MQQQPEKEEKTASSDTKSGAKAEGKGDVSSHVEYIKELAQIVADEGLSKLEVETGGVKITIKGTPAPTVFTPGLVNSSPNSAPVAFPTVFPPASAPALPAVPNATPAKNEAKEKLTPLVSPMVGVFYRAPSPSDPDFVAVGDTVTRGQTIGLVEAMKVFNEITAEHSGVVASIPVESGTLVETGQPLIFLK